MRELLHAVERATSARELKLHVLDRAGEVFGARAIGLYLFGPDGNLSELHTRGVRDGFILVYEQLGRGHDPILERVLRTRRMAHDGQVFRGDDWPRSTLYRECGGPWQIQHYLCAPIVVGGDVVGTFNLGRRSPTHPFGPRDSSWATELCRRISARLQALAREPEHPSRTARPTLEDLGRLAAHRTQLRLRASELERSGRLDDDQARALWDAMMARQIAPLDTFDHGDRTYVVLPVPEAARVAPLTKREIDVVRLAAAGLADKEIAYDLGISPNTVGTALLSARKKLGAPSRVKLVEVVRRLGLEPDHVLDDENERAASSPRERTPSLRKIVAT